MLKKGKATVVRNAGSHYMLSELPQWNLFPAVLRGKVRLEGSTATNPVAVGDRVSYSLDGEASGLKNEEEVIKRTSRGCYDSYYVCWMWFIFRQQQ